MILKKREKILALAAVMLLMAVVLYQAYSKLRGPYGRLENRRANAVAELEQVKTRQKNAKRASDRLDKWRRRSLPSDTHAAQSLYQNWLFQSAHDAGFSDTKIDAVKPRPHGDVYYALKFTFNAKTTLDGLTKFLHCFYSAGHLHQILNLTITPEGKGKPLKVRMTIEALSLTESLSPSDVKSKDVKSKDELSKATSQRKLAALDVYKEKIVVRNLFAAYQTEDPKPQSDPAKDAYLTMISTGNRPKAWITVKTTGDSHELREGNTFDIGETKCEVLRIGQRDAEIEIDGKRFLVLLGQNLREAKDLSESEGTKPSQQQKISP